jgi:hypothetical protein
LRRIVRSLAVGFFPRQRESLRGRPLGRVSTDKTLLPSIFLIEFFLGRPSLLSRLHPIPSFRSRDSGPLPGEAIRSVTHQVLARAEAALPFSLKAVLLPSSDPCAQLGVPSPENVQCRAVFIQFSRIVQVSSRCHQVSVLDICTISGFGGTTSLSAAAGVSPKAS